MIWKWRSLYPTGIQTVLNECVLRITKWLTTYLCISCDDIHEVWIHIILLIFNLHNSETAKLVCNGSTSRSTVSLFSWYEIQGLQFGWKWFLQHSHHTSETSTRGSILTSERLTQRMRQYLQTYTWDRTYYRRAIDEFT